MYVCGLCEPGRPVARNVVWRGFETGVGSGEINCNCHCDVHHITPQRSNKNQYKKHCLSNEYHFNTETC